MIITYKCILDWQSNNKYKIRTKKYLIDKMKMQFSFSIYSYISNLSFGEISVSSNKLVSQTWKRKYCKLKFVENVWVNTFYWKEIDPYINFTYKEAMELFDRMIIKTNLSFLI